MLTSKGYIIQLETLMQQKQAMPGAKELIQAFQMENVSYLILTERSSVTVDDILNQLESCGVYGVKKENVYTSTMAAVEYIITHDKKAIDVDYIGGKGIRQVLTDTGFHITHHRPQYFFVGMDSSLSYDEYQDVFTQLRKGSQLVSVDHRRIQMVDQVEKIGNGTIVRMLEYAADVKAMNFGCGTKNLLKSASTHLPYSLSETIMIGNRFKKDIVPALQLGMLTFYVAGSEEMMKQGINDELHPDYILDDLTGLLR